MTNKVENISLLIQFILKSRKISQVSLSKKTKINLGQLNRFLNGHNDMYLSNFISILDALDIDLENTLQSQVSTSTKNRTNTFSNNQEALFFLFGNLSKIEQKNYLKQLERNVSLNNLKIPKELKKYLTIETRHLNHERRNT